MPGMTHSTDLCGAGGRSNRGGNMGYSPYETMGHPKEKAKRKTRKNKIAEGEAKEIEERKRDEE